MELIAAGQRYGRWTILEDQQYTFTRKVKAKCDCGNKAEVRVANLRIGRSQSCGCINREILSQSGRSRLQHPINPGDVFGRLTVQDATDRNRVLCLCECGNTRHIKANALYRGSTRSCGCLKSETAVALGKSSASRGGLSTHTLFGTWKRILLTSLPVHEPWSEDPALFIKEVEAEIGPRPNGLRITLRKDSLGYTPGNIYWGLGRLHKYQITILTDEQRAEVAALVAQGTPQYQVAKQYGVSSSLVSAIYKKHRTDR